MTDNVDFMSFDDIPDSRPTIAEGEYVLRVVNPVLKETKSKTNKYLNYDAVVQEGPEAGYRIFRNMFSLGRDNVWSFKAAMKAVGFAIPAGLTVDEVGEYFVNNANGFEFVGTVIKKPGQSLDEATGKYVDDASVFANQVKRWLKAVV